MENRFEWDENKNKANIRKHGVSFREAATVFLDENALVIKDDAHSGGEERFIIIGFSAKPRLLVVCHCFRESPATIRIISARKAAEHESKLYGGAQ
ncbi:MAG: BrnT family toxin [Clostridiales bacterium]|nr:BrnT family toxin [Clostridiales bacterium]